MDTEIALGISTVVVVVVEVVKRVSGVNPKTGMLWAVALSCLGCLLYGISFEPVWARELVWKYFTAVVLVAGGAVGIHSTAKNTKELWQNGAQTPPQNGA